MRRILLLPVIALLAMMFTAVPASAATVETFTLNGSTEDTTAVVGQTGSIQGTVGSVGAFEVFAEGTAANDPGVDGWGGQVGGDGVTDDGFGANFTFLAPGTYTFSVRLTENSEPDAFSDTITVVVEAAAGTGVVPAPVTFPDACTVTVPTTEGVRYVVDFGDGDVEDAFPGTLPLVAYYNDEEPVTFRAEPLDGVTFDPEAPTEWVITPTDECFGTEADLVSTSISCGAVRFTNTTDRTVGLFYGNPDEDDEPDVREIAPSASTVVRTELEELFFVASAEADNLGGLEFEAGELDVPQDCADAAGAGASHPTVAPAAGAEIQSR